MNFIKKNGAGLLLCLIIAIPAWFAGQAVPVIGGPVFAILAGMIITLILTKKEPFTAGINYTSKKILQAAVVFLGFGASALCFVTWNLAVKLLGVVRSSIYIYLNPVITVVAAGLILHEPFTLMTALGTFLTLAGLFLSSSRRFR